jgi:hypothetical protein
MGKNEESKRIHYLAMLVSILLFCSLMLLDISSAAAELGRKGVEAVELLDPPWPKDAIVALNNGECGGHNGAVFGGTGDTYINPGGIFTNGCLAGNGSAYQVIVDYGYVRYVGQFSGSENFDPNPEKVLLPITWTVDLVKDIRAECAKLPDYKLENSTPHVEQTTLYPGNYPGLSFGDGDWILMPGLYCVAGDITVAPSAMLEGDSVTLFVIGGDVSINGGALLALSAPRQKTGTLNIFTHLLFYVTEGNVTWTGGSDQHAYGRVYAPQGKITLSGNSSLGATFLNVQLVGWNVEVTGSSEIEILPGFLDDPLPFVESNHP